MRVLLISPYGAKVNPYIGLLSEGLTAAGASVATQRVLSPADLTGPLRPDVIHLHWVEGYERAPSAPARAPAPSLPWVARGLSRLSALPVIQNRKRAARFDALFSLLRRFQCEGGRVAYTAHNLDPHEAASTSERRAISEMFRLADVVHAHDRSTAAELAARYGREDARIIPHGNYLSAYPNGVTRAEARAQLGLSEDAFVYACIGLLRPYKGLDELLPAFRSLESDNAYLLVAGKASDAQYAQRLAALSAGDTRIRLEPRFVPGDELQLYFNAADMVVLPYRQITTSGAAIMAFSFGAPVLAPALGAFPELLAEGRGMFYEPGQLREALAAAQAREWTVIRPRIIEWVRQFDWTDIGRALLDAYMPGTSEAPGM